MTLFRWSGAALLVIASQMQSFALGAKSDVQAHREVDRIHAHFDSVLVELSERDVSSLSAQQRLRRTSLETTLRSYSARSTFPHNYDFPEQPTPYFIDRKTGTLCAVAFLLESTGRRDIVDRVASTDNNVWVAQLAGDSAFTSWLEQQGITLSEAARIQVPYVVSESQIQRETALAVAAPVSFLGAIATGTWNAWGNANGHSRVGSVLGVTTGALAIASNARMYRQFESGETLRNAFLGGAAVGGVSVALAIRAMTHRSHFLATQRARTAEKVHTDPQLSVTPIFPTSRTGSGLSVALRF